MADRRAREQREHQVARPEEGLLMHGLCHDESIQSGVEEDGHDEKDIACQLQMIDQTIHGFVAAGAIEQDRLWWTSL